MKRYTMLMKRPVLLTHGLGEHVIIMIDIECEDKQEAIRHATTLKARGDVVFKIFQSDTAIFEDLDNA